MIDVKEWAGKLNEMGMSPGVVSFRRLTQWAIDLMREVIADEAAKSAPQPVAEAVLPEKRLTAWGVFLPTSNEPDKPVAVFQYSDSARTWAKATYPDRHEVRETPVITESEISRRVAEVTANNDTLRDNSRECRQECVELRQQLAASQAEVSRLTRLNETPRSFDEAVHGVQSMIDAMGSMDRNRKEIAKLREEVSRLSRPVEGVTCGSAATFNRELWVVPHAAFVAERNVREAAEKRAVAAEAERDELREFRNACIVALTNGDWAGTVVKGVRKALDKLEDSTAVKVHEKPIIDQLRLHKPNETFGVCSRAIMEIKRLTALLAGAERERDEAKKALIGQRATWAGHEWTIVGINYLGDFDLERFEDRPDGRYKIGGSCVFGLPREHPHYAELATATERAEKSADARQAEIVAWLRKQKESEAIVEAAVVAGSYADAIEAGDFQAKGGGDAPRSP